MSASVDFIEFDHLDIENVMAKLTQVEVDNLHFGAIELSADGTILQFNAIEGRITGRDPKAVIGKNFFSEVAPCTNRPTFRGKFTRGVRLGQLNTMFEYTFDYLMQPTRVKVHMKKALIGDSYWVFVKRI